MTLQYLLDEHVPDSLRNCLARQGTELTVWHVGDAGAPQRGTLDPEILIWCEERDFVLVTNNRGSMPVHLAEHLASRRHVPGIFVLDMSLSLQQIADDLELIAQTSINDEYGDMITFLPLSL